ncbi:MAG: hypothetical protein JNJ54_21085 [Myxococcaceae bacterium]|nr:hypothetical protein [Myxococcaceae bacterium]
MNDQKLGNCLPLYLKNRLVLSALEDGDDIPGVESEDQKLLASFRERSSDQAVTLLEELYAALLAATGPVPYRLDRRSQRRTVRDYWYMEGRIYRPRERTARAFWNLFLGCLKDLGPAVVFILGPQDFASPVAMDDLAAAASSTLGVESANPRHCFTHKTAYEAGVVAAQFSLNPAVTHSEVIRGLKSGIELFFNKHKAQFEAALES